MGLTAEQATESFIFNFLHKKCEYCDECPNEEQICDMDKFKSCIIKEIDEAIERMPHLKKFNGE